MSSLMSVYFHNIDHKSKLFFQLTLNHQSSCDSMYDSCDSMYDSCDSFHNIDHKSKLFFQRTLNHQSWAVAPGERHVMIAHDALSVFRHSSLAKYTVVSLEQR